MDGHRRRAAIAVVLLLVLAPSSGGAQVGRASTTSFDVALRLPARTTDRSYLQPAPKTGGQAISPEILLGFRTVKENWEARAEGRWLWRRSNVAGTNREQFFGAFEFGPRWGATSLVIDWQPTHFYDARTHHELLEQQEVGLKFKHVTPMKIVGWAPVSLFVEASRVTTHPAFFSRNRLYAEAQWTQRRGARTRITWLVESGYARYDDFFGKPRRDVTFGLRRTTRLEMGSGLSLALSIYGAAVASTHAQKSGFDFEVRPELRWRFE